MQSTTCTSLQDSHQGGSSPTTTTPTPTPTSTPTYHPSPPSTTTTRTGSTKRPLSPSSTSLSPIPEKCLKKSPVETIQGFSKLPLPITFPPLNRTMSEPISKFNPKNAPFSPFSSTSSAHFSKTQFQETAKKTNSLGPSPSNALQKLFRSISDPTTLSFGVQTNETPSSQRVEKMKGIIKGISELCDEVICEEEKENEDSSENVNNEDHNKECVDNNGEEAVSVEKKGESLVVHFSCPCGIDYEILLSGNNCYYRLT